MMKYDLTYYKHAYDELDEILNIAFDQITVADKNGIFVKISQSTPSNFGISKEEIIGQSAYDLEKRGIFDKSSTVKVLEFKKQIITIQKTLNKKKLLVTGKPIFDDNGDILYIINMSKDITNRESFISELKRTEQIIVEMKEQFEYKNDEQANMVTSSSPVMIKTFELINHVSSLDTTLLLLGETGVGKSYLAREIHNNSPRKSLPFVQINCGSIPENLLESELFGYVYGAFTGTARGGKKGLFEKAGNGTVFLDEISELPLALQVKLLHVLQEKSIYKLGSTLPIKIEARIISATNKDLHTLVKTGLFREDLYYRLNIVPITIPPLRERKEDIPLFILTFLKKYNDKYNLYKEISVDGINIMTNHYWSGNIRELENAVEYLVVTTSQDIIDHNHIQSILQIHKIHHYANNDVSSLKPLRQTMNNIEREIFAKALDQYKTTRKIAEILEIDQSTVVKKLQKLNIR